MKYVHVTWLDACSTDEWTDIEGAKSHELVEVQTAGILIHEDDVKVVVGLSKNMETEAVSNFIAVPKVWIKDRKELKLSRPRKVKPKPV